MQRRLRQARMVAQAFRSSRHPVVAQIVPVRRCNLSCTYCNEYDKTSQPVPTDEMVRRVDRLAALGTTSVTLSGGEPLLHPEAEKILARVRRHGMMAGLLTNGYLLTADRVRRLNRAGLEWLQISVDNVDPDDVSKKSLKVLDQKLQTLAEHAEFDVNINSVVGGGIKNPEQALTIAHRALELGFSSTVGIIHDHSGQLRALDARERRVFDEIRALDRSPFSVNGYDLFQENIARGLPNRWSCRAGSRFLYVTEDGLVHWCSQQRGYPGIPLAEYTAEHLEREFHSEKPCAPLCTVSCVQRVAVLDGFRERPLQMLEELGSALGREGAPLPLPVRTLKWMFLTGRQKDLFTRAAIRAFGLR